MNKNKKELVTTLSLVGILLLILVGLYFATVKGEAIDEYFEEPASIAVPAIPSKSKSYPEDFSKGILERERGITCG